MINRSNFHKNVGLLIHNRRKIRRPKMTQVELGRKLGYNNPESHISMIERGVSPLTLDRAVLLCRTLHILDIEVFIDAYMADQEEYVRAKIEEAKADE